jgi:2-isopropylmalate synthase
VNIETGLDGVPVTEATVKVRVGEQVMHTASEGDGPVNALDGALRKALLPAFPNLNDLHLADYKVRVVNARAETAARVRVVIEWRTGEQVWGTVGVSENVIEASWKALRTRSATSCSRTSIEPAWCLVFGKHQTPKHRLPG